MPISAYISKREYIVTVQNFQDLDSIYADLETHGKSPAGIDISRSVECLHRRSTSRNTHYLLTDWEANELANDTRIKSVTLAPHYLGIQAGTFATEQTSSAWDKSSSTGLSMKNWGLLRCTEGTQRSGWGGTGYQGNGSGTAAQTSTITLTQTGRNVDVVICDLNGIVWDHPEYAVNADGTGGSRAIQYNWYQHNAEINNGANGTYSYGTGDHSTHVAGTVAGNTQGWARNANIYNIYYDAGNPGNFSYVFDYIRAFHRNKTINNATGRKNPTIVNNSWGQSIFSNQWTFGDITAVTYRGTRYTPSGAVTYNGVSGVYTTNTKLADLINFENGGNRITTSGPYVPPGGSIISKPSGWTQEGQEAFLTQFAAPDAQYTLTVQGPADISFISDVAADAISGTMDVQVSVVVKQGPTIVNTYTGPVSSTTNGGSIESIVEELTVSLADTSVYTIEFNTTLNTAGAGGDLSIATAMRLTVITDATGASATVGPLSFSSAGSAGLSVSTIPTNGNNDDGYWTLNLPFSISYLGTSYSTIYVSTNHYLTFGSGSTVYIGISASSPNLPKIMWCAADNSAQRIYYGVEGTAPNRTYRVRLEGNGGISGTLNSPGMVCEYIFYENTPAQIDLQCGVNNRKTAGSGFTTEQLNGWGFISGQRIPSRVAPCDVDLEDLYDEGIIMVGAAGNGRWKHDVPGGADWNNSFEMASRYPDTVTTPYFYMRGTSPTANDNLVSGQYNLPAICVGSVDSIQVDQKVQYSDCGVGVDIWAPGTYIISALPSGTGDPRNGAYFLGKYSGTSMASPQVCGVLACALELYPHMTQTAAKAYILAYAKNNQLTATSGGATDPQDLQGAPNKFLYYYKERLVTGNTVPKTNYQPRPSTGSVFPRPRIRRTL
jgi:hypothetical protein